jgi:hypothetical protein
VIDGEGIRIGDVVDTAEKQDIDKGYTSAFELVLVVRIVSRSIEAGTNCNGAAFEVLEINTLLEVTGVITFDQGPN